MTMALLDLFSAGRVQQILVICLFTRDKKHSLTDFEQSEALMLLNLGVRI